MISKKIVIMGHFGVGKTSLIRRFVEDAFSTDYKVTIGVHILKKEITVNNTSINLIIWDTEGSDDIIELRKSYLIGSHGFIIVSDVTRPLTYAKLEEEIDYLKLNYPQTPLLTVGNKSDLLEVGTIGDKKQELSFIDILVSAKEGNNVQRLFEKISKLIIGT